MKKWLPVITVASHIAGVIAKASRRTLRRCVEMYRPRLMTRHQPTCMLGSAAYGLTSGELS